jgi:CheY-like chemotaxis protein/two-component sensor histidine kinase
LKGEIGERQRLEEELREADRRKDEFLAMLAHELRNPLAPIRTGLDVLAHQGAAPETVAPMREQVVYLARLVDDLLDVSRILRGQVHLQWEPVEAETTVHRAVETVRPLIESQRQELTVSLPEKPACVQGDPVRLAQIVTNLLHNAAKYTNRGGRIWLTVSQTEQQVAIAVRDNGMGIEAELLPRVFDLFTQADRSIERSQGGLGIGLTLVRSLVEMHGGSVTARSDGEGCGSEFIVRLPRLVNGHSVREAPAPAPAMKRRRVLIVDDNLAAAKMLAMLLQALGDHAIELAYDGPSALEKAAEFQPEIVLLDIGLPHMSGYEVARRLRANERLRNVILVAVTGYGAETDRRQALESGCDEHLLKPIATDDLIAIFNRDG